MKRIPVTPRSDYREKIEALGFDFHGDYWREEAYYRFTAEETACLEKDTLLSVLVHVPRTPPSSKTS